MPAAALRAMGANVPILRSWDQAIDALTTEFAHNKLLLDLAKCKRVLVQFEDKGVAVLGRSVDNAPMALEKLIYDPDALEPSSAYQQAGTRFSVAPRY